MAAPTVILVGKTISSIKFDTTEAGYPVIHFDIETEDRNNRQSHLIEWFPKNQVFSQQLEGLPIGSTLSVEGTLHYIKPGVPVIRAISVNNLDVFPSSIRVDSQVYDG